MCPQKNWLKEVPATIITDITTAMAPLIMSERLDQKDDDICACPLGRLGPETSIRGLGGLGRLKMYFSAMLSDPESSTAVTSVRPCRS